MKIKTRPFELSKSLHFKLSLLNSVKKSWWIPIIPLGLAVYSYFRLDLINSTILFVGFAMLWPLALSWACWKDSNSLTNKSYFQRRFFEFDDEFISVILDDGSNSHSRYDTIVKVIKTRNHFQLYISKILFIYIPFDCFESEEDLAAFQNLLKDKLQITLPF